jgi:hypothetical protein
MATEVNSHPLLQELPDVWVASQALLKHSSTGSIEQELQEAIHNKNASMLQMLVANIEAKSLPVSPSLYNQAKTLLVKIGETSQQLKEAIKSKQVDQLSQVIQDCIELDFSSNEVIAAVQLRTQLLAVYKEAALALNLMDVHLMQTVMKETRELGLKNTAELNDIHHILFEMDDLTVKGLQVGKAEELNDAYLAVERRIALKDEQIKSSFFRSDWKTYPSLKDPKVWASSLFLGGSRHHTFHQYTRHIIHESLSILHSPMLNKLAVKCFKSLLTVTGDRIAGAPNFEAFVLLDTAKKHPALNEELYLQLMKQLTSNPDPVSLRKGWNLFALFLRSFPAGNLEEYCHAFIRKSCENSEGLLKLMYYSINHYPSEITQDFVDRNLK